MKNKIIQWLINCVIITIVFCTLILPIEINASDSYNIVQHHTSSDKNTINEITPYAEVTGYKYKILNKKQYKRLWSYTYNRWIDPDWTLA